MKRITLIVLGLATVSLVLVVFLPPRENKDRRLFEAMVITPAPASLSHLEVRYVGGVDARASMYFEVSPSDLDAILDNGGFQRVAADSERMRVLRSDVIPRLRSDGFAVSAEFQENVYVADDVESTAIKYLLVDKGRTRVLFYLLDY